MTITRAVGEACNQVILLIVRGLALSKIHPNMLTFIGLLINVYAAVLLGRGEFFAGGLVVLGAGLFDMVDGRVARHTNQVTMFGGFFDSVLDRYSDLGLLMGLLVYYASIDRFFYVVLTAVVMTGSVMVSYTRARAENTIPQCKVGFAERPEGRFVTSTSCQETPCVRPVPMAFMSASLAAKRAARRSKRLALARE